MADGYVVVPALGGVPMFLSSVRLPLTNTDVGVTSKRA